jgi:hypothetical protein
MNVDAMIEEARELMATGKGRRAADVLITAAIECRDPEQAGRIHQLGLEGRETAGFFSRRSWDEVIRVAEKHGATAVS